MRVKSSVVIVLLEYWLFQHSGSGWLNCPFFLFQVSFVHPLYPLVHPPNNILDLRWIKATKRTWQGFAKTQFEQVRQRAIQLEGVVYAVDPI
jgi:hypothetical protein